MIHIGIALGIILVRSVYQEPFTSFVERAGTRLTNEPYGYRKQAGELIRGIFQTLSIRHVPLLSTDMHQWKGQGARQHAYYQPQHYSDNGIPIPSSAISVFPSAPPEGEHITVDTTDSLLTAVKSAKPGQVITIKPGIYRFHGRSIPVTHAGTVQQPIMVRANRLGEAQLEFSMLEGFHVMAPYWVFENLIITGTCKNDSDCEHAFHVVGDAQGFVLRNSTIKDFNAHVKVNGSSGHYPDNGLIEHSNFYNQHARKTPNPVNLLNINSVDNWRVQSNLLADFMKSGGDKLSYGAFMKGNGRKGIFENNLVICEMNLTYSGKTQVALSFGGGGTGTAFCRDQSCETEHSEGIIKNNIILNCPTDVAIYLNKAAKTRIYHNALINTLGIDARFGSTSALIANNIIAGRIKDRDGATTIRQNNLIDIDCVQPGSYWPFSCAVDELYQAPYTGDFRLQKGSLILGRGITINKKMTDFCDNTADPQHPDLGPIQYSNGRSCLPLYRE